MFRRRKGMFSNFFSHYNEAIREIYTHLYLWSGQTTVARYRHVRVDEIAMKLRVEMPLKCR